MRTTPRCRCRGAPALAVRGPLRGAGKSSRLVLSLRSPPRRVGMRLGDRCQAHRCAGGDLGSTRITETGLAARNRLSGFPAPPPSLTLRGAAARTPLRGPRPSSAGSVRTTAPSCRGEPVWIDRVVESGGVRERLQRLDCPLFYRFRQHTVILPLAFLLRTETSQP